MGHYARPGRHAAGRGHHQRAAAPKPASTRLDGHQFKSSASVPTIAIAHARHTAPKRPVSIPATLSWLWKARASPIGSKSSTCCGKRAMGEVVELRIRREGLDFDMGVRLRAPKPGELEFDTDG